MVRQRVESSQRLLVIEQESGLFIFAGKLVVPVVAGSSPVCHPTGDMVERLKAPASKTGVDKTTGGSNPSISAKYVQAEKSHQIGAWSPGSSRGEDSIRCCDSSGQWRFSKC